MNTEIDLENDQCPKCGDAYTWVIDAERDYAETEELPGMVIVTERYYWDCGNCGNKWAKNVSRVEDIDD